ncbi:tyrosine-type recombinase/integrase [Bacteroides pyogenes]|uniref:tyrosine-type recombinase/integrase n=1 Tax=Bacteroides pyogenes TaxID=310300 RepID=UPI002FD9AD4A
MKQLTEEQQQRFSSAIKHGFITAEAPQNTHTFVWTWIKKHPNRVTTLVRLREIIGHAPRWEDITDDVISDLKDDMEFQMAPNSVKTICAELKAVLNRNKATKPIKSETFGTILKAKKVPSQNIYLTKSEIQRIYDYKPKTEREKYVRRIFLIECVTGARNIDCRKFTLANIHTEDDEEVLTYVPQKHPVVVNVPAHKWLKELLAEDYPERLKNLRISHFNNVLKWICRQCGINKKVAIYRAGQNITCEKWEIIGSHVGRKSFVTNLYLAGVSIEDIAMMVGHFSNGKPNIVMTYGYVAASRKISKTIYSFFTK